MNQQDKYIISHSGPMGSSGQQNTAAAYFARTRTKQPSSLPSSPAIRDRSDKVKAEEVFVTNFSSILTKCPPPVPSSLLKRFESCPNEKGVSGVPPSLGKVKVIVRVANSGLIDEKNGSYFVMDKKKRQVTLFDPAKNKMEHVSAPKMFAFDGLFTDEDSQSEIAAAALTDPIHGVVNGTDACLFCFGHANLGKTYTMIGSDESSQTLGVIPTAIAWLFKCIKEKKDISNAKFSVRVTAMEIGGSNEEINDLLSNHNDNQVPPPSAYFTKHQSNYNVMQNLTELRCPTQEKAFQYLDSALSAKAIGAEPEGKDSHFVFTLHVYQYSVDKSSKQPRSSVINNVMGGRSRLHLIDFGSCERMKTQNGGITLSSLGHVILGICNGQKHLPFKESPVTLLLKECLNSLSCQATMLAHISPSPAHYSETLHTTQLASRMHRMRRKKTKSSGSSGGGSGSGSSDDMKKRGGLLSSSDLTTTSTDPSSSEQSCDTVIYVGDSRNDDDDTDAEHPPVYLPNLNSGDNRGLMAKVLRGSIAEQKQKRVSRSSTLERHHQPRTSPVLYHHDALRSPQKIRNRPGSVGSTPTRMNYGGLNSSRQQTQTGISPYNQHHSSSLRRGGSLPRTPKGKMPLHGRVAGYRQHQQQQLCLPSLSPQHQLRNVVEYWIDQPQVLQAQTEDARKVLCASKDDCMIEASSSSSPQAIYAYGYMDEHKKSMIQKWVECQAEQMRQSCKKSNDKMVPVKAPPSLSSNSNHDINSLNGQETPEPFAWLRKGSELNDDDQESGCKVLTHFKMVESSEDSSNDQPGPAGSGHVVTVDVHNNNNKSPSPAVSSISVEEEEFAESADLACKNGKLLKEEEEKLLTTKQQEVVDLALKSKNCCDDICLKKKTNSGGHQNNSCQHQPVEQKGEIPKSISTSVVGIKQKVAETTNSSPSHSAIKGAHIKDDPWRSLGNGETEEEEYLRVELHSIAEMEETTSKKQENEKLSPVAELTECSSHSEKSLQSDESGSNVMHRVSSFDSRSLHYANKKFTNGIHEFYRITNDNGNLDQLAKLHELYASVSSISAKSQSHLEEKQLEGSINRLNEALNGDDWLNQLCNRGLGSTVSLGALELNEGEEIKSHASDINSLCSEPVNLPFTFDCSNNNHDRSHETYGACNNNLDLGQLNSLSLSDLGFELEQSNGQRHTREGTGGGGGSSNVLDDNVVSGRSDSPVLEGIDQELAKYAKLKDLKQAYQGLEAKPETNTSNSKQPPSGSPKHHTMGNATAATITTSETCVSAAAPLSPRRSDHVPDGASNPDLNFKAVACTLSSPNSSILSSSSCERKSLSLQKQFEKQQKQLNNVVIPNRSPGTGQSSCGSDPETTSFFESRNSNRKMVKNESPKVNKRPITMKTATVLGNKGHRPIRLSSISADEKCDIPTKAENNNGATSHSPSKKNKIPKFSRLFGKKISRSPLKIRKEEKKKPEKPPLQEFPPSERKGRSNLNRRMSADKTQKAVPSIISTPTTKDHNILSSDGCTKAYDKVDVASKKGFLSPKNAQGTPLPHSKESLKSISSTSKGSKGAALTSKQQLQTSSSLIPSPYSVATAPLRRNSRSKNTDTSSNDSGLGTDHLEQHQAGVRLRGSRGANNLNAASSSKVQKRAKHCSSGYESSLPESIESPTNAKLMEVVPDDTKIQVPRGPDSPNQPVELNFQYPRLEPLELVRYQDREVQRLDTRGRFQAVNQLKCVQNELKVEMDQAKQRIGADPKRWSYELHVEESGFQDKTDPAFLEAFGKETEILQKRVNACKSHVKMITCFDVKPLALKTFGPNPSACVPESKNEDEMSPTSRRLRDNCCTTDCEFAQNILLHLENSPDKNETDIF